MGYSYERLGIQGTISMAENETLELLHRRCRPLLVKIQRGVPIEEAVREAERCLAKTIQNLIDHGFPLGDLLASAERRDGSIREIIRRCYQGVYYAELLGQLGRVYPNRAELVPAFLRGIVEQFLGQIEHEIFDDPDITRFQLVKNLRGAIEPTISSLAHRLLKNPDIKPRMLGRSHEQKERDHAELMSTSLLEN